MKIKFDDGNGKVGVEGWYNFHKGKLVIYVKATNSNEDWISNFIAFRSNDIIAGCKVHSGYKKYARWMQDFIIKKANIYGVASDAIYIFGTSMGGGIAQILGEYSSFWNITSIDGPRTTSKLTNMHSVLYFNKGSFVHNLPFWFKKIENQICLNQKWRPFWVSHANYDTSKIISEVME